MLAEYNKSAVADRFSRCAERYQQHADLQSESANILGALLRERLLYKQGEQQSKQTQIANCILDLGCGPGIQGPRLRSFAAQYVGVDIASGMLAKAVRTNADSNLYIQADMENLPFTTNSFDLVYSNLAVQWSNNPLQLLQELQRITKPGGVIAFSTVLNDSLQPLARLRSGFLNRTAVNEQPTLRDWLAWCKLAGFQSVISEERTVSGWFQNVASLLRSISAIGADHQGNKQAPKLGVAEYTAICKGYEHYRTSQGLPLNYQLGFFALEVNDASC
ncbi:methylase involved in ubiquinone/menaquinone biosynthesis [Idiomarina sp. A28L]|uniref:methyltransferase domain-containing protein n=1 Tax=Idiomarina sp. A28L TaxID=1036674 RepID=UPI0002138A12|nr:methyltransferase domain-containing protein [Idiomarina sp. A28L]EGN75841.1 methylase involved in ubiquinone/menaquinone biosynthesis [Idiomarina sp. A28L]